MRRFRVLLQQMTKRGPWRALGALASATGLYAIGVTVVYVPVALWLLAKYVPLPSIFRSWLARLIVSLVVFYSLFQLAVVVQFFVFPESGFTTISVVTAVLVAVLLAIVRARAPQPASGPLADRNDVAAGVAVACFAVPLVLFAGLWRGSPLAITQLAGVQSYDAVNHFIGELEMSRAQHLTYRTVDYYPKGFHITTVFIQESAGLNLERIGWAPVARIFIGQYMIFGALLAYVLVYACLAFYRAVAPRLTGPSIDITAGLAIGTAASIFYLLPFTHQGFINYYYGITCAVCGLLYVLDVLRRPAGVFRPHWYVFGYFLLLFGLSMSWPLLIPPFAVIGLLCVMPDTPNVRRWVGAHWSWGGLAVIASVLLQTIPVYFQLKYWKLSTGDGLNTPGSITAFHFALLAAGLALTVYAVVKAELSARIGRFVTVVYLPLYLFVGALAAYQYMTVGEVRYFAIKVAYSLEILLLVLAVALVVRWFATSALPWLHTLCAPVVTVVFAVALLNGVTANPLLDLREMFRAWSNYGTPAFYEADTAGIVKLGTQDNIANSNAVVLHFDAATQTLYGNLAVSKWATVVQVDEHLDMPARACADRLFPIAMFQAAGPEQQASLRSTVQECIALANVAGRTFYVVTDEASEGYLRPMFAGNVAFVR